jgi:hypothetical protein
VRDQYSRLKKERTAYHDWLATQPTLRGQPTPPSRGQYG